MFIFVAILFSIRLEFQSEILPTYLVIELHLHKNM